MKGATLHGWINLLFLVSIVFVVGMAVGGSLSDTTPEPVEQNYGILWEEISILTEQKQCEEWGGDFEILRTIGTRYELVSFQVYCSKEYTEGNKEITETLFDYEF